MVHIKKRNYAIASFISALIIVVSTLATTMILRNLDWLVGKFVEPGGDGKFDFVRIFEQTKEARLSVHWLFPLLLGLLFFIASLYLLTKIKRKAVRVILDIAVFFILLVAAFICSLLLTRINEIRFGDLLAKLLPLIDKL